MQYNRYIGKDASNKFIMAQDDDGKLYVLCNCEECFADIDGELMFN